MTTAFASDSGIQAVHRGLLQAGYDDSTLVSGYDYAARNGHVKLETADLVAFSDPLRHDLQTSCIAAQRIARDRTSHDTLERLFFLAVPLAVMVGDTTIDIWSVKARGESQHIVRLSHDRVEAYFAQNKRDLGPASVSSAKSKGVQFSFFQLDPDLYQFAYDATRNILVSQFEEAVRAARQMLAPTDEETTQAATVLTRLALQILAAAILEDKGTLETTRSRSVTNLLSAAQERYPDYFNMAEVARVGADVAEALHSALRRDITFRSFTNMMLAQFYEEVFVTQELRKELGIYYTPAVLAQRILARLPIEEIPPEQRTVLDGTCGSGNLLLAAHERLAHLLPVTLPRDDVNRYLLRHIHGVDTDSFATLVSRLALFLTGIPASGRWDIREADFLALRRADIGFEPRIIVGNPPFKESQQGGQLSQKASIILDHYLDMLPDDGLLGIVLPETFLENRSSRRSRQRLLTECDILETWHLPQTIFASSRHATIVVLAKKVGIRNEREVRPMRAEWVAQTPLAQGAFLDQGKATFSFVAASQDTGISDSPSDVAIWSRLTTHTRVGDVARVQNGIKTGKRARVEDLAAEPLSPEWKPWLAGGPSIEPYLIKWAQQEMRFVRYPGHLERPRPELERQGVFAGKNNKVLVNVNKDPGYPWRLSAAIDNEGFYFSEGINCVIPTGDTTVEELAALFNSPIASLWVDSRDRSRRISKETLKTIPYPPNLIRQRGMLQSLVRQLMQIKKEQQGVGRGSKQWQDSIISLTQQIDSIVLNAFGITAPMRQYIETYLAPYPRPGLTWLHTPRRGGIRRDGGRRLIERTWTLNGEVIQVSPSENVVLLQVSGYNRDEPFMSPIPEAMPGWALREGAVFYAEIPWGSRDMDPVPTDQMRNFRPLDFAYVPNDNLALFAESTEALESLYMVSDGVQ